LSWQYVLAGRTILLSGAMGSGTSTVMALGYRTLARIRHDRTRSKCCDPAGTRRNHITPGAYVTDGSSVGPSSSGIRPGCVPISPLASGIMSVVRAAVKRALCLAGAALVIAACSDPSDRGGIATTTTSSTAASARQLEVNVHESRGGVSANNVTCSFDGDQQLLASGVVRNAGETESYVSIEVRFVDADDVRVELATDSVSALEPGESARWDVSSYPAGAAEADGCVVSVDTS
jgi:hypothetical protein